MKIIYKINGDNPHAYIFDEFLSGHLKIMFRIAQKNGLVSHYFGINLKFYQMKVETDLAFFVYRQQLVDFTELTVFN